MAAVRFLEERLSLSPAPASMTVFGAEALPGYNRVMLSPVLAGEKAFEDIVTHHLSWYAERAVTFHAGVRIASVDRCNKTVMTDAGICHAYDRLVLATGSRPIRPDIPGAWLPGVYCFRDFSDTARLLSLSGQRVVVVGGGLLGLEAAAGLLMRGAVVTLLHEAPWVLNRQLDSDAGAMLGSLLAQRGMVIMTGVRTAEILAKDPLTTHGTNHGDSAVRGVRLAGGDIVDCDAVVFATGVRPDVSLAREAGLSVERGVQVDDYMQTSDPAVFAIGECVQWQGKTFGTVAPLYDQARVCASRLAGADSAPFTDRPLAATLKVSGIHVYSCGELGGADCEVLSYRDEAAGICNTLWLREDRIVGAVLFGDTGRGPACFERVLSGEPLGAHRDDWLFGGV
jgi:nitrite reductase (NADH) large subunit